MKIINNEKWIRKIHHILITVICERGKIMHVISHRWQWRHQTNKNKKIVQVEKLRKWKLRHIKRHSQAYKWVACCEPYTCKIYVLRISEYNFLYTKILSKTV